jgi:hypothetical protein
MRLVGSTTRIMRATGQVIGFYCSARELDGFTLARANGTHA